MTTLRILKKLLLGETWFLPIGIATTIAAGAFIRRLAPTAWPHVGAAFLLAGALALVAMSVARTARGAGQRRS